MTTHLPYPPSRELLEAHGLRDQAARLRNGNEELLIYNGVRKQNSGGSEKMPALGKGRTAPDFTLNSLDGKPFSLRDALARGPVVLVFFKVSCPTCQYALPFYERLFQAYKDRHVTMVGVSQNNAEDTAAFAKEFGVKFPLLLDDTTTYPVSNAYGLTNVPTVFWIARDGEIELSSVGWVKSEFEEVNLRMAESSAMAKAFVYRPGEDVRDYRGG